MPGLISALLMKYLQPYLLARARVETPSTSAGSAACAVPVRSVIDRRLPARRFLRNATGYSWTHPILDDPGGADFASASGRSWCSSWFSARGSGGSSAARPSSATRSKRSRRLAATSSTTFSKTRGPVNPGGTRPGPKWLVDLLGVDFFGNVTSVTIGTPQTEVFFAHIGQLQPAGAVGRTVDKHYRRRAGTPRWVVGAASLSCKGSPGFSDGGLAHLAGLKRLESLWIEGSPRILGPGLAHLAGLQQLRSLLIHNETDAGLPNLSRLTGLRTLFIDVPTVNDATLAQLSRLTMLKELAFGGETGSDAGMAHLRALTNLETLQLHGPWFTDAGLAPLSEMDHLSTFFVSDETSVTGDGLNNLQQRRPTLRIGVNGSGRVSQTRLDLLRSSVGPEAVRTGSR